MGFYSKLLSDMKQPISSNSYLLDQMSLWRLFGTGSSNEEGSYLKPTDRQVGGNHYKQFSIQPTVFSERNKLTFLEGDIVKRVCRHNRGGKGREDIEKAIHELQLILELHYTEETVSSGPTQLEISF